MIKKPWRIAETRKGILVLFMLLFYALCLGSVKAQDEDRTAALLDKAWEVGAVRVIVILRASANTDQASAQDIAAAQTAVMDRLTQDFDIDQQSVRLFDNLPYMALDVDAAALELLLQDPDVVDVQEDVPEPPTLYQSIPLIDADNAWAQGFTGGRGITVAILDTGVNKNHPFLSGKVVSEACYSTRSTVYSSYSLCPGGASSSTASGSGLDCTGASGCGHGTHVAGIAAGKNGSTYGGQTFHGVGRETKILAIKVFSWFTRAQECSPNSAPCVLAFKSDQIAGLDRVYALRNSLNLAAANMSLGGGNYPGTCDGDARKPIIDKLRNAGIATVISAGNKSYTNAMGAPACISTSISVGSTTKSDGVSSFSNVSASTDVWAPGSSICSSVNPGGVGSGSLCGTGFGFASGTSMAAPHVTGAWAVMKSKNGFASVTSIENALEASGKSITDGRYGGFWTKPRIDLDGALARISPGPQRGFTWDHCQHVWQSGSTTWCWTQVGGFWISSSNDQTEKVFINGAASNHWVGYNVSNSGAINYIRLYNY